MRRSPLRSSTQALFIAGVVAALGTSAGCGEKSASLSEPSLEQPMVAADGDEASHAGEKRNATPDSVVAKPSKDPSADGKAEGKKKAARGGKQIALGGAVSKSISTKGVASGRVTASPKARRVASKPKMMQAGPRALSPVVPREVGAEADPIGKRENGDGTFESAGVNPFVSTEHDRLSTFAIDVDTGSYTYAKGLIARGQFPAEASVRVEEWINAFHYAYPDPEGDAPFAVHLAGAPSPFVGEQNRDAAKRKVLRVGIQGKRLSNIERNPAHITFLVDVSGSMSSARKMPLVKHAMRTLVNNLRGDDYVAIVTYAGRTEEVLPTTSIDNKQTVLNAITNLRSGGGTNMGTGMELAFRNAGMHLAQGVTSRVVVMSDGDANIGRTRHEDIRDAVRGYVSEGVTLSTVGFGNGNYNDHLMEQLADAGNGNYSYIDSEATAERVFGTDLVANLQVIAQDVKIQVEFNPEHVRDYRLLGYENRDVADADFRNDKKDAGEIGAGHSVTAVYEMSLNKTRIEKDAELATVRIRHKTPRHMKATEQAHTFRAGEILSRLDDADDDTRHALAVAMIAEQLRGSPYADRNMAKRALELLPKPRGDYAGEREEFAKMSTQLVAERDGLGQRVTGKTTKFTLTATERSDVEINGRYVGETPIKNLILAANQSYSIRATTKRTATTVADSVHLTGKARQHHQLNIKALTPNDYGTHTMEDGFLTVRTEPWAKISIDGAPKGSTPLFKVQLKAGRHKVRLVNKAAGINITKTVHVAPGKNKKIVWKLN